MTEILNVGSQAPNFSLNSTQKDKISLAEYAGTKNVLVAFFPLAFTPG